MEEACIFLGTSLFTHSTIFSTKVTYILQPLQDYIHMYVLYVSSLLVVHLVKLEDYYIVNIIT